MFANLNFAKKADFIRAVERKELIVLWSPEAGVPAINGVVTVESWNNLRSAEGWVKGRPHPAISWMCKVRVHEMRVVEVLH